MQYKINMEYIAIKKCLENKFWISLGKKLLYFQFNCYLAQAQCLSIYCCMSKWDSQSTPRISTTQTSMRAPSNLSKMLFFSIFLKQKFY